MKMKWLSVLTALLCFAATATGQGRGFMYSVSTEVGNNFRKNTGFSPIDVAFTPGYAFDGRFFVGVPLTLSNELFRTDGIQNYENNFRMGISAGYNILSGHGTLVSLSAAFGGSVYTQYHRSLYYDLCAKWGTSAYFKPLVGLGVRYYQSLGAYAPEITAGTGVGQTLEWNNHLVPLQLTSPRTFAAGCRFVTAPCLP